MRDEITITKEQFDKLCFIALEEVMDYLTNDEKLDTPSLKFEAMLMSAIPAKIMGDKLREIMFGEEEE